METKFNPIEDRVIIKKSELKEEEFSGNIIIPDLGEESSNIGIIIAKGPGFINYQNQLKPMQCNIGDLVLYPTFGPSKFNVKGEEYIVCRESELLTIIEEND